jgi:hypothetical protein
LVLVELVLVLLAEQVEQTLYFQPSHQQAVVVVVLQVLAMQTQMD